jgi:hypothetical protein
LLDVYAFVAVVFVGVGSVGFICIVAFALGTMEFGVAGVVLLRRPDESVSN